jgi:arsenite/tail-anchored protein-transporting ATPase
VARLAFFIGKGGVGKTTLAAAFAVYSALKSRKRRVLLISTDPAHSLGDIFHQPFHDAPEPARSLRGARLYVWEVNAEKQFHGFLSRHRKVLLTILESGSLFSREDIEPLLDTSFPGMAEMAGLLALEQALTTGKYEKVIVDTAPLGHTLRLLQLPHYFRQFLSFLEFASSRDRILAEHFGGTAAPIGSRLLAEWNQLADAVTRALKIAEIFLVTTSEKFALNESLRSRAMLAGQSPPLSVSMVVLNRAVTRSSKCKICEKRLRATRAAQKLLKREFPNAKLLMAEDVGAPLVGPEGLAGFGGHVFARRRIKWKGTPPHAKNIQLLKSEWPVLDTPLLLTLGKGGVGKTTISAALGFRARQKSSRAVEICSVDPAPSLDDIFQTKIGDQPRSVLGDEKFRAAEMDSVRLFHRWVDEIKNTIEAGTTTEHSGIHVDLWFERQLLTQLLEIVPPGIDEVIAIIRIAELLGDRSTRVVIDMAPTGHALDLLRTPERILAWTRLLLKTLAAHRTLGFARDAAVKVAELGQQVRDLLEILKDPKQTRIVTVVLPEPLPDRETERLMRDLEVLGLSAGAMFINRVLFPDDVAGCRRCEQARRWQDATLARLADTCADKTLYVARNFPAEIAGRRALGSFTGELWRVK